MSAKSKLEWIKFLVQKNPFPEGMTGKQWAVLSREMVATIETKERPRSLRTRLLAFFGIR
jgi:hypothetical protein